MTPTQFSLLTCLVYLQSSGSVTAAAIVRHTGMDKMTVSDLVTALEKKKLLRRKPNPEDGRSFLVEATLKGIETTDSAVAKVEAIDAAFFRPVGNLKELKSGLVKLAGI